MAVAGQRSTSSYSTDFGLTSQTIFSSLSSTPRRSGPSWISLENTSFDQVFGPRENRQPHQSADTLVGYRFTCDIVFDPGSGVSARDYSYSFDIIVSNVLGTHTIGTVSGTETVTEPEPPEPEEPEGEAPYISFAIALANIMEEGDTALAAFNVSSDATIRTISSPSWISYTFESTGIAIRFGVTVTVDGYVILVDTSGVSAGSYEWTIEASNDFGSNTLTQTIRVVDDISVPSVPTFYISGDRGSSFSETQNMTLNNWSYFTVFVRHSIDSEFINLNIEGTSITISGTIPSTAEDEDYFTLSYTAFFNPPASHSFLGTQAISGFAQVTISTKDDDLPSWSSSPSATVGSGNSFRIDCRADGGTQPITYTANVISNHQQGANFSGGILSGTAIEVFRDITFEWFIQATNSAGTSQTVASLTVRFIENLPSVPSFTITGSSGSSFSDEADMTPNGWTYISTRVKAGTGNPNISYSISGNTVSISGTVQSSPISQTYIVTFALGSRVSAPEGTISVSPGATTGTLPTWNTPPSTSTVRGTSFTLSFSTNVGTRPIRYTLSGGPSGNWWQRDPGTARISGTAPDEIDSWSWTVTGSNVAGTNTTTATLTTTEEEDTTGPGGTDPPPPTGPGPTTPSPTPDEPDEPDEPVSPGDTPTGNEPPSWGTLPLPLGEVTVGTTETFSTGQYVSGSTSGGAIIIQKTSGPTWATVSNIGVITASPPASATPRIYSVGLTAISVFGVSNPNAIATIRVVAAPVTPPPPTQVPVISSLTNQSISTTQSLRYDISGSVSNNPTSYSISSSPSLSNLRISTSGVITLANRHVPSVSASTDYTITVTASNSAGTSASQSFTLTIRRSNPPRFQTIPESAREVISGQSYSINLADYTSNYTTLTVEKLSGSIYDWATITGTTLSGTAPSVTSTSALTFFREATNDDGTVRNSFVVTIYTTSGPTFYASASDDQEVDEGEEFRRHFGN